MTFLKILPLFPLAIFAACSTLPSKTNKAAVGLCSQLPGDLAFIHRTLAENNSNYNGSAEQKKTSDESYKAIAALPCQSELDYVRAVKQYMASYHDPHVNSLWSTPDQSHAAIIKISTGTEPPPIIFKLQWSATGIFLQRYNGRYYIKAIDHKLAGPDSLARVGDELKSCNGVPPAKILQDQILPYVSVSAQEAARYRLTPAIFARWDQVVGTTLKCEFLRSGSTLQVELSWHQVSEDYIQTAFQPAPKKIYEIEKTRYGHWIKLKSLAGYDKDSIEQLKHFSEDASSLRGDKVIVMDLRGNGGGTSSWGTDWIQNLYGYQVNWDDKIKESVFVSKGNIEHYDRFFKHLSTSGGIESDYAKAIWHNLIDSLHHSPLSTFAPLAEPPLAAKAAQKTDFKGKVIVLTDYNVFSSGETFLEQLKMMPRVKQAGIATNASTYYSDVRFVITPGGLPFDFPTKKDSGDPLGRKSGEALAPDWPLNYDIESELKGVDSFRRAIEHGLEKNGKASRS